MRAETFSIDLELGLRLNGSDSPRVAAAYSLEIGRDASGRAPLAVLRERWMVGYSDQKPTAAVFEAEADISRLRLPGRSAESVELAALESALRAMRFYELETASLRSLDESTTPRQQLGSAGTHLGRVLGALAAEDPSGKKRLDGYLSALVPAALSIDERREGRYSTIDVRFRTKGDRSSPQPIQVEVFPRESISEGTLRAAGVLAALFQLNVQESLISLIGIEEPETALHPANVGALYEALDDAAQRTQVIVTTQSSALLDNEYVSIDHLRVVESINGATVVGEIDQAGRAIVGEGLRTISQLHASGQMRPMVVAGQDSRSSAAG